MTRASHFQVQFRVICVIPVLSLFLSTAAWGQSTGLLPTHSFRNQGVLAGHVFNLASSPDLDFHLQFQNPLSQSPNSSRSDEGRVWGGVFLVLGTGCTLYGFLERDIYYSQKHVERTLFNDDGLQLDLFFTMYSKTHANPHTALYTSIGLFLNGSYWMLKDRVDGVDLEDYSPMFSERKMAYYSVIFGSLVVTSAFLIPEYTDEVRRGYLVQTEPGGRIQYYPIQDERRLYSYRQASVNVASGLVYMGFGLWKIFKTGNDRTQTANRTGSAQRAPLFSCMPSVSPAGLWLTVRF